MRKTSVKVRRSGISSHTKHQTGGIEIVWAHSSATLPNGQVNSGSSSLSRARKINPRSRSQHLFPFLKTKEKKKTWYFPQRHTTSNQWWKRFCVSCRPAFRWRSLGSNHFLIKHFLNKLTMVGDFRQAVFTGVTSRHRLYPEGADILRTRRQKYRLTTH